MSKSLDIKNSAKYLGLDVPTGDDQAVLSSIASQVGFDDFDGSDEAQEALYSRLVDLEKDKKFETPSGGDVPYEEFYDLDDDYYDDEQEEYYDDYQDNNGKGKKEKKESEDEEEGSEGKEKSKDGESVDESEDSTKIQNNVDKANKGEVDENGNPVNGGQQAPNGSENYDQRNNDLTGPGNAQNPNGNPNEGADRPNELGPRQGIEDQQNNKNTNQNSNGQINNNGKKNGENPNLPAPVNNDQNPAESPMSNGYNSRNINKTKSNANKPKGSAGGDNITDGANKTLNSNNKAREGRLADKLGLPGKKGDGLDKGEKGLGKKNPLGNKKTGPGAPKKKSNILNRIKNRKKGKNGAGKAIAKSLAMLAKNPYVMIVLIVLVLFFLCICIVLFSDSGKSKKHNSNSRNCNYNLSGVISSGNVELNNIQVELINCDGKESDYNVIATVPFEKYVLGVALAEIGESSPDEAIKAQIIAARNFALTRNKGMCPGNQDNCFYGYNKNTGKIRMRACEADQVYWDYTKDSYREDRGSISRYSPEITTGTLWKRALSDQRRKELETLALDVMGKVLIDGTGNVASTPYNSTTSSKFLSMANEGKKYDEILSSVYGYNTYNNGTCTSAGNIDYGDYSLSSSDDQLLHESLDSFLVKNGSSLEEYNEIIANNVDKAGFGTREGVVAAAVTLIAELGDNYNVKLPYFWGGGHGDGVIVGAKSNWGSSQCHTYANNQNYNYCGLDCSGFAAWAIKNGGFNIGPTGASGFKNISGMKKVTLNSNSAVLQPGDLLSCDSHVVVIVGIDEENHNYICAEASGNAEGVWFTRRPFSGGKGYYGLDLTEFYSSSNNIRGR